MPQPRGRRRTRCRRQFTGMPGPRRIVGLPAETVASWPGQTWTPPTSQSRRLHDAGRQTRMFVVLSLVTAAVLGARAPAVAHSSFDGTWNVLFVTEAGQCGPPFRYDISIVNGVVVTSAEAAHDMSGHVDLDGNVRISVYRAAERAVGSGRLQNKSGAGIWKGVLSAHRCSGSWQAERH